MKSTYSKEIYPLKNKSKTGQQHYGYIIFINGKAVIRQWHKPRIRGYVFMTKSEANKEADNIITSLKKDESRTINKTAKETIEDLENQIKNLQIELKKYKAGK